MTTTTLASRARTLSDGDVTALQVLYACATLPTVNARLSGLGFVNDCGTLTDDGRAAAALTLEDCAWCGGESRSPWPNLRGETFCSRSHRQESNAALRRLLERGETQPQPPTPTRRNDGRPDRD